MLMGISDYSCDPGQSSNFLRRPLCVTPGHYNLAGGIRALNSANSRARVLVGCGGDGAGIQNDDIGLLQSSCCFQPALEELALYSSPVSLRRSTAKILYVKARHSNIVT